MTGALTRVVGNDDRDAWNGFVRDHPSGHFFQTWDWGVLQDRIGGVPQRVAVLSDGRLVGAAQLLVFEGVTRTFAYVPRGPVVDETADPVIDALISAIVEASLAGGASFLRLEPQWAFTDEGKARLERRGFTSARQFIMPRRTIFVDLAPSVDDIWSAFHSNTRNRIRLAQKRGVEIRVGREDEMAAFVGLFEQTIARHGLRPAPADQFYLSAEFFGRRDDARLYLASHEGVDLAGIIVFINGATATYQWGASSAAEAARQVNPHQLLHSTAMQWARERGCTTYDLFGIPDYDVEVLETEYARQTGGMWNLYRFKRGFGGVVHRHLGTFDWVFRR